VLKWQVNRKENSVNTVDHDENASMEDALESLKDEAREEGYQQGYLDALNDVELHSYGGACVITNKLRKMVTSK
jgi:hypothetical protein